MAFVHLMFWCSMTALSRRRSGSNTGSLRVRYVVDECARGQFLRPRYTSVFRRTCKITKRDYWLRHVCLVSQFPLKGFSWNLCLFFFKTCWENSIFIEIWQEHWVLYMNIEYFTWTLSTLHEHWALYMNIEYFTWTLSTLHEHWVLYMKIYEYLW